MPTKVLFLGPDGAGKSTLLQSVQEALPSASVNAYLGIGKDGWRLKAVQRLSVHRGKSLSDAVFWYVALPLEMCLRRTNILRAGRGSIVLIDRVPGKPLLSGKFLRLLYIGILPRPNVILLLQGDPTVISSRKPEETTSERTVKELRKWKKVAERLRADKIVEIDTTRNELFACRDMAVRAICDYARAQLPI